MRVFRVELETEGIVRNATREVGRLVETGNYVSNTSLYYALGLVNSNYVDTLGKPTYIKDTKKISDKVYVAPATAINELEYMDLLSTVSDNKYATLNLSASDPKNVINDKNYPKLGTERVLTNQNRFKTYLIVKDDSYELELPKYFRLGKKRGKVSLSFEEMDFTVKSGSFTLNHPIGAYDTNLVPQGSVLTEKIRPAPLIIEAEYEGDYLRISGDNFEKRFPGDVEFLRKKR